MKKLMLLFMLFFAVLTNIYPQATTKGLVGYWPFNGNANDESCGGTHNGTVSGATLTADRFGKSDSAYYFNGTTGYISMSTPWSGTNVTFSLWLKFAVDPYSLDTLVYTRLYPFWNSYPGLFFQTVKGGLGSHHQFFFDWGAWRGVFTENIKWKSDVWYHLVMTYNGSKGNFYVNGALNNDSSFTATVTGTQFYIGKRNSTPAYPLYGTIDDIRIYNRELTANEIKGLYREKIIDTVKVHVIDSVSITVTDTLIINANLTSYKPLIYANTIKIYPNPAKDHIIIQSDNNSMGYQVKILNSLSQTVYQTTISQAQYSVDLKTWTGKGTYFVQLYDNQGKLLDVKRIILQ